MTDKPSAYGQRDEVLAELCEQRFEMRRARRLLEGHIYGHAERLRWESMIARGGLPVLGVHSVDPTEEPGLARHRALERSINGIERDVNELVRHHPAPWRDVAIAHFRDVQGEELSFGAALVVHKVDVFRQATGWNDPELALPPRPPREEWSMSLYHEAISFSRFVDRQAGVRMSQSLDLTAPPAQERALGGQALQL